MERFVLRIEIKRVGGDRELKDKAFVQPKEVMVDEAVVESLECKVNTPDRVWLLDGMAQELSGFGNLHEAVRMLIVKLLTPSRGYFGDIGGGR
jgi:hypothetical protein